jgi:putative SOS response-associated peptidase YedK
MFRTAVRRRRCLIPADGFYEWRESGGGSRGKKQPYFIHRPDNGPFAFAGLWETWTEQKNVQSAATDSQNSGGSEVQPLTVESCTIVTTSANATLSDLHERMPDVLAPCDYETWLDLRVNDPAAFQHLLAPCGEEELVTEPVSTRVNRVANDDPRCIEIQQMLF